MKWKIILFLGFLLCDLPCKSQDNMITDFFTLSAPEKWWVITHFYFAPQAWHLTDHARNVTDSLKGTANFKQDAESGQLNAVKHAYWLALLSARLNPKSAIRLGFAHEKGDMLERGLNPQNKTHPDYLMDTWNNYVGVSIGKTLTDASNKKLLNAVLDSLCAGRLRYFKKKTDIPLAQDSLNLDQHTQQADPTYIFYFTRCK